MSEIINKKKNYDINLALLRIYLSILVVNSHCLNIQNIKNKYLLKLLKNRLHVPIFFIISFYYCKNLFISKNITKIRQRFERLLIPNFSWPIIIWILNNLINYFYKRKIINSFNDLIMQLLAGHCFMTVLWFQYNLIFITLLMIIIQLLFKQNTTLILINLWNISYFLQFSDLNYKNFSKYNFYIKYTFGRFFEILPYCITGFILSYIRLIDTLKKIRKQTIFIIISNFFFFIKSNIFIRVNGFMYQGINLYIASVSLFIVISLIPLHTNKNNTAIIKIIKMLSNLTSGIYYLHVPIKNYLNNYILLIKNKTFLGCIIIIIFCYFISITGIILLKNTKLRHLFQ